jgi:hypothetical protein
LYIFRQAGRIYLFPNALQEFSDVPFVASLCHFVISRKHKLSVVDGLEINASLSLPANFYCSTLGVLLKDYVFIGSKTVLVGKVIGNLAGGYVILFFAIERFPMANKGVGKIAGAFAALATC